MRFPTHLVRANLPIALACWAVFAVIIILSTLAVAIFGHVTRSVWDQSASVPRWYALVTGVLVLRDFLPLYIAHGQTRRRFAADIAITFVVLSGSLAILMAIGYLLEHVVFGLAGWPHALDRGHLFTDPTQAHLVFTEYLVVFAVWLTIGAVISAAFYRWPVGGLPAIPVGIGLMVLAESGLDRSLQLPLVRELAVSLPSYPWLRAAVELGVFLAGLALGWAVIRDVPLRNRPS